MVRFIQNFPVQGYHTFGTSAKVRCFFEFSETEELQQYLTKTPMIKEDEILVLGGGSNLLFAGDFPGIVYSPAIGGIKVEEEDSRHVWIRAGAGIVWDDFVQYVVETGWGGVENLSYIPGKVGASPVQNIGAYGQEAGNVIELVSGVEIPSGTVRDISADQCLFGYRNSIFKKDLKGKFLITSVVFRLKKFPEFNLDYREIREAAEKMGGISLSGIRNTVIDIRRSKLPDPGVLGNAGSFFKNPVVRAETALKLSERFPGIPCYSGSEGVVKLSAGWMIDQCGWKGYRSGDAGVHEKHALVLVNYGRATGKEIYELSERIIFSVKETFGIDLEREVLVVGGENLPEKSKKLRRG